MPSSNKVIQFKPELDLMDLNRMDHMLLRILLEFFEWCCSKDLDCIISSLMEDAPGRKSRTHAEGRAFDASTRIWNDVELATECADHFNSLYATSLGTAPPNRPLRVCVYHSVPGSEPHLHFQVRRR